MGRFLDVFDRSCWRRPQASRRAPAWQAVRTGDAVDFQREMLVA
jgi:hypothetical protein